MRVVSNVSPKGINWISGERLDRVLLTCTVALAGMLFWIAPRPGMVDLPQHAAQVAIWRDLVTGASRWSNLVRINYFTPYLLGYGLALIFSFIMPIVAALKLVMMFAFYGYVAAGVKLRKEFKADRRLDWLLVPGFFGFAYQWGLYSDLVATPLALLFLILARRFAQTCSVSGGLLLSLAGIGLFFSHGLVFLFACATGAAFIPFFCRTPGRVFVALAPYVVFGLLAAGYNFALHRNDLLVPSGVELSWSWAIFEGWHRSFTFLLYTVATTKQDWYLLLGVVFLLAAPWLMGAKLNRDDPTAFIMIAAVMGIWCAVPSDALGVSALYQRFAIFLLPAYALVFREVTPGDAPVSSKGRQWLDNSRFVRVAVVLFCWCFLCVVGLRQHRFALASAPFEEVLAAADPGQRALNVVFAPESTEIHNLFTYLHYPLWYQVDKGGFVDFNFASALPQIVRFRPDRVPAAVNQVLIEGPRKFDWHAVQGRIYRYFFVHHTAPLPVGMFNNDECEVVLVKDAGEWSLFERRSCR
jgi:hypothetical protein